MEFESGLELDWYFEQFTQTTNNIDYSIVNVQSVGNKSKILIKKDGRMPMPLDISILTANSDSYWYNIPLRIMRGAKQNDMIGDDFKVISDWPWVYNYYEFEINIPFDSIKKIQIDPSTRLADINLENNIWIENEKKVDSTQIVFKNKL
jgi:hypothetical protein